MSSKLLTLATCFFVDQKFTKLHDLMSPVYNLVNKNPIQHPTSSLGPNFTKKLSLKTSCTDFHAWTARGNEIPRHPEACGDAV